MTFPRALAIAELGWSKEQNRHWDDFVARVAAHMKRLQQSGIAASDAAFAVDIHSSPTTDGVSVTMANQSGFGEIRYTTNGSDPDRDAALYVEPLALQLPADVRAQTFHNDEPVGRVRAAAIDTESLSRHEDRELALCQESIVLALEDDAPLHGERESFLLDIMDPCWILQDVNLDRAQSISAAVGQLPFNFEIGDLIESVRVEAPRTSFGELRVRLGDCTGPVVAELSLAPAIGEHGVTQLPPALLVLPEATEGRGDLCFRFTRNGIEPIWTIDWVQVTEKAAGKRL
jgi:hexosaminidase